MRGCWHFGQRGRSMAEGSVWLKGRYSSTALSLHWAGALPDSQSPMVAYADGDGVRIASCRASLLVNLAHSQKVENAMRSTRGDHRKRQPICSSRDVCRLLREM